MSSCAESSVSTVTLDSRSRADSIATNCLRCSTNTFMPGLRSSRTVTILALSSSRFFDNALSPSSAVVIDSLRLSRFVTNDSIWVRKPLISSGRSVEIACSSREISWNCPMPPPFSTSDKAPSTCSTCADCEVWASAICAPDLMAGPATGSAGLTSATYFSPSSDVCSTRAVVPAGSATSE